MFVHISWTMTLLTLSDYYFITDSEVEYIRTSVHIMAAGEKKPQAWWGKRRKNEIRMDKKWGAITARTAAATAPRLQIKFLMFYDMFRHRYAKRSRFLI